ncbi:hypothetical protein ACFL3W_00135 [Pseudomonadota bacterium]
MKLFIDIDGVLLGKSAATGECILANHAKDFLEFCLANFDCYWLTTHCRGSVDTVLTYLAPYASAELNTLIERIKPTNFKTFKTEALCGDFIWIDDQPTAYEIQVLDDNNQLDRWYQVNTRKNPDDLLSLMESLQAVVRR